MFLGYRLLLGAEPSAYVSPEDAPIEQIRQDWFAAHAAFPSAEQEAVLRKDWVDEEVLYRRALELGLDQSDAIVRRRLVQLMRFLIEDMDSIEPPTERELQAWLEEHPGEFAEPGVFSFTHRFFSRGERGAGLAADARSALGALKQDPEATVQADPFFRGGDFEDVTPAEIKRAFGTQFAQSIAELPLQQWAGPVKSSYGLHLVYVRGRRAAELPKLEELRDAVEADWLEAARERQNEEALAKLRARYAPGETLR